MNVDTLRDLADDIAILLALADRLAPVVSAYAAAVGASPAAEAVEVAPEPAPESVAAPRADGRASVVPELGETRTSLDSGISTTREELQEAPESDAAGTRSCAACGEAFAPSPRVGNRQRYCSTACRIKESLARQKLREEAKQAAAGWDRPMLGQDRPMRVPIEDDPERAAFLRCPPVGIAEIDGAAR